MKTRTRILAVGALLLAATSASAQPDSYCSRFEGQMEPDSLYVDTCPGNGGCLTRVQPTTSLQSNRTYRFLYKTPRTDIQNSLVVIQLKQVAAAKVDSPANVRLTRQQLDFACRRGQRDAAAESIPVDMENGAPPEIGYSKYDQFHRYGYTSREEQAILLRFHTRYYNGMGCVSTLDRVRRAQFLFTDQSDIANIVVVLWTRFGAGIPAAAASEITKFDRLQVILGNYKKRPQASGCVSFGMKAAGKAVEIGVSDLEEKARSLNVIEQFTPKVWTVSVM